MIIDLSNILILNYYSENQDNEPLIMNEEENDSEDEGIEDYKIGGYKYITISFYN